MARPEYLRDVPELQDRAIYAGARAALFHAEGRYREGLEAGAETARLDLGAGQQGVKQGLVWAVASALALGENSQADELLSRIEELPPGLRPPFLEAHAHRFRARMNDEEAGFKTAAGGFREYNFPFWLAVTELEHGEWLARHDRPRRQGRSLPKRRRSSSGSRRGLGSSERRRWISSLQTFRAERPNRVALSRR